MNAVGILVALVVIGYIGLYLYGRRWNMEHFAAADASKPTEAERRLAWEKESLKLQNTKLEQQLQYKNKPRPNYVLDTSLDGERAYMTNQDKYGDFEQDFVYQNEGGFDPTQEALNSARRKFPFEWSQLPPSASLFQAQQALFVKDDSTATAALFKPETFNDIDATKVLPPDGSQDQAELDALRSYQAKTANDLASVDSQSVNQLIKDIYGKKGLVAKVAKKANNVFEIYEVQEKKPKIVYEDESAAPPQNLLNPLPDDAYTFEVPSSAKDVATGLVPTGRGASTAVPRQTYSNYNPNLEGIFGPKMQWQQWG
jgi:hypothetical protein